MASRFDRATGPASQQGWEASRTARPTRLAGQQSWQTSRSIRLARMAGQQVGQDLSGRQTFRTWLGSEDGRQQVCLASGFG
jgi:hypothetical protein